jgi:hypothetical protein
MPRNVAISLLAVLIALLSANVALQPAEADLTVRWAAVGGDEGEGKGSSEFYPNNGHPFFLSLSEYLFELGGWAGLDLIALALLAASSLAAASFAVSRTWNGPTTAAVHLSAIFLACGLPIYCVSGIS